MHHSSSKVQTYGQSQVPNHKFRVYFRYAYVTSYRVMCFVSIKKLPHPRKINFSYYFIAFFPIHIGRNILLPSSALASYISVNFDCITVAKATED